MAGWIGCDLDKTLARYMPGDYKKYGKLHIGQPIPRMVAVIKYHLQKGETVKIFTARLDGETDDAVANAIGDWTEKYLGERLEATNVKTRDMFLLYDDRAVGVIANLGLIPGGALPHERLERGYR